MNPRTFLATALLAAALAVAQSEPVGLLFGPVPVDRVVDGDTVVLQSNLGPRIVRLIGIDTPEVQHPEKGREPFGPEASAFTAALLPEGTDVWVEVDFEIEDAYGRLLAYVYVEDDAGAWRIGDTRASMVNLEIARAGFARSLHIEPNMLYADLIDDAVSDAEANGRGIWAASTASDEAQSPSSVDGESATRYEDPVPGLPPGDIVIMCTLFNPTTPNDVGAETVSILVRTELDLRGYFLHDADGSGVRLPLTMYGDIPGTVFGPGVVVVTNPGQGIWNNAGDTIYLKRGDGSIVDEWDYTSQRRGEGVEICRGDP